MSAAHIKHLHFVDDASDELLITSHLLRKFKLQVQLNSYTNFEDFFQSIKDLGSDELYYSLLVLDLNLAITSGIDGIREIRSSPTFDDVIVGICSGSDDPADIREANSAGASFFVQKPLGGFALQRICDAVPELDLIQFPDVGRRIVRKTKQ